MSIDEILKTKTHRPWELPNKNWKYYQEWNNTIFLHWKVDEKELQKLVPNDLELDLFEGSPWVSLVAFTMEKIRPKNLPAFSPISNFHEINIRTYVKYNGKPGVYFLSIEGGNSISCQIARSLSELPYRYSNINRKNGYYHSSNSEFSDELEMKYKIGDNLVKKTGLDIWLTERYALFQDTENTINSFEIHHIEWPVNALEITQLNIDYPRFNHLINPSPERVAYSTGVQVIAWGKVQHRKQL